VVAGRSTRTTVEDVATVLVTGDDDDPDCE
jgi:hypothetical protein